MWQTIIVLAVIAIVTVGTYFSLKKIDSNIKLVDSIIKRRYLLAGLYFVCFVLLGIHGFSVDKWSDFIETSGITTKLWGFNRSITSDVWAIGIPQLLNQIHNGFPLFNHSLMSQGANSVLAGLPALDFTLIGQPHYWGCLFGDYIGLSWLYWFKIFALLLSAYEVLNFLLRDKKRMAMLGALVITFSPLMSWWLGHTVSTVVIYMHVCVAAIIIYTRNINNLKIKIVSAIIGAIGLTGFILGWYPALQVPFSYLAIILVFAVIYRFIKEGGRFNKSDIPILGIPICLAIVIVGRFIYISLDSISALMNTVFPGARFITGGGYDRQTAFYYLFQPLFAGKHPTFLNECETSSILPFIPVAFLTILVIVVFNIINKKSLKKNILMIVIFIYEIFLISWLFIGYPNWFAKVTLFSNVLESRVVWCIGIISVYLGMMALCYIWENIKFKKLSCLFSSIGISIIVYIFISNYIDTEFLNYFGIPAKVVLISVFILFTFFNYAYLSGLKKIVISCLLILSIGSFISINPIQRGSSALTNNDVAKQVQKIANQDGDAYWLADGFFVFGNFLSAQGVNAFNVTNQYMDAEKWCIIDPEEKYQEIYNRYAQVSVEITGNEETMITLESPDLIKVKLSIEDIKKLKIEYVLSSSDLDSSNFKQIYYDEISGQKIFSVIY